MADSGDHVVSEEELQGLIFDCDGTLIDTMPAYWEAWVRTCRLFGIDFNEKRFYDMAGIPVREIFEILLAEADYMKVKPDLDVVCKKKKEISFDTIAEIGTPRIEMVVDIARKYHGKVPLAVASSGNREHVIATLRNEGILDLFDAVVTAEDIANPKPAPDIFLLAAHKIGCDPTKCRGFEDAEVGLKALRAAGMQAIDVRKMPGYPKVVPSTRSVLEGVRETDGQGSETDDAVAQSSGQGKGSSSKRKGGNGVTMFVVQVAVVGLLAYGAYVFLNDLMYEAVKEEAWSAD